MTRHETYEQLIQASAAKCANCGNSISADDFAHNSRHELCCSEACATLSDRAAPLPACANCGGACEYPTLVRSLDGLPFCSAACERSYPKPASSPEVRRILWTTAAAMLVLTAFLLALIIHHFTEAL
jgi:hypothetical protein